MHEKKTFRCRSCQCANVQPILSLGQMPLANRLLTHDQLDLPEPVYPLELVWCPECGLVQITESVPPEQLFLEYPYFSSVSETMLHSCEALVMHVIGERKLSAHHRVIEIASNDGYLLQYYRREGIPILGIEPAINIAKVAREQRGIPTLAAFFDAQLAHEIYSEGGPADVIHANNVLAHVADLNSLVEGLQVLLKEDGVAIIEVPYLRDMIMQHEFDTIYHEHLCYFSGTTLNHLFTRHGLTVQDVEHLPLHGGSLRLFVGKASQQTENVKALLRQEADLGMNSPEFYTHFAATVEGIKDTLNELLRDFQRQGKRLAAYGAAAKGSTLLNYLKILPGTLDFVVDRSPYKQGHYMPGIHLPIAAPGKLLEAMPDYVLLLAWNIADEVLTQQAEYLARGGQFIIPIPEVRIITAGQKLTR